MIKLELDNILYSQAVFNYFIQKNKSLNIEYQQYKASIGPYKEQDIFNKMFQNGSIVNPSPILSIEFYIEKGLPENGAVIENFPSKYSIFSCTWYDKKYLKGDYYEGRPLTHFTKFGLDCGLRFSAAIDDETQNKIYKNYATIVEYSSISISELNKRNELPILVNKFYSLIKKNKLENRSLLEFFNAKSTLVFGGLIDDSELIGRSFICVIERIDLGELKLPKWFNYREYLSLNQDLYDPNMHKVFLNYLAHHISQQRQLSSKDIFAPKNIIELCELLQIRAGYSEKVEELKLEIDFNLPYQVEKKNLIASFIFFNKNLKELEKSINSLVNAFEISIKTDGLFLELIILIHINSPVTNFEVAKLRKLAKKIIIAGDGANIGYGRAHNNNFIKSQNIYGDDNYFLVLNSDGELHPDSLINAAVFMKQKNDLNSAYEFEHFPIPHPKFINPISRETPWFSGAAVLFYSKLYAYHEGYDEGIFLYCEDVDFSIRIKLSGGRVFTFPDAYFRHFVSNRDGLDSLGRYKTMLSSALRITKKWNDFENYMLYFNKLMSSGVTSYDEVVEKNMLLSIQYKVGKLNQINVPIDIDLSNLHFSKSRKFII